jgi:limonene-1,2-epoxide hydrolase
MMESTMTERPPTRDRFAGTSTEIDVVLAFLGALEREDLDAALDLLDDEIVYQNVPLPAARGKRAVAKQLGSLDRDGIGFEVEFLNVAANGPIVLTERTDVISIGPVRGEFWVCGTFEVRDGRIVVWRDRFDYLDFFSSFVRGGVRTLRERLTAKA